MPQYWWVLVRCKRRHVLHCPRCEPSPCTKLPQYTHSVKGHNWINNKPLHSHLVAISAWAREGWLGRQHLSLHQYSQKKEINSAAATGQQAVHRGDGIQQDATGCCGVPQDAAEPGGGQDVFVPQMLLWALQASGRDRMSPLQRQLPSSQCKSCCVDKSPGQVQRSWALGPGWAPSVHTCQAHSLVQNPEGAAGRLRWMCSCPRRISHLAGKGSPTWHLILAPSKAASCICRPEQISSRPV